MSGGVLADPQSRPTGPRGGARLAVCAPNAFKGTLSAAGSARALALGVRDRGWTAIEVPVADGGDGTLDVLLGTAGSAGREQRVRVTGPLGGRRIARLGWLSPTVAVVEMAEAAGLRLVETSRRDPLRATSRGAGELIAAALDGGARRIIVGIGGSASTDGGAGLLTALGARVLGSDGRELPLGGGALVDTERVDVEHLDSRLRTVHLEVAVDVGSPLLGVTGAAHVFAPQKGANPSQVRRLDRGLRRFAAVAETALGVSGVTERPGAGAAGGCGFALALLGGRFVAGAGLVCDEVGLDAALDGAALVITGEGRLDAQTARGKAPAEVLRRARERGIPCLAVCGVVDGSGAAMFDGTIALTDLGAAPRRQVRSLLRHAGRLAVGASAGQR